MVVAPSNIGPDRHQPNRITIVRGTAATGAAIGLQVRFGYVKTTLTLV
jgi:hypothetical protein